MQFKVPQDVQREDTIFWFLTMRQLMIMMVGGGISYGLFFQLSKVYELGAFEIALICIPAAIAALFAFLKIKGMGLTTFIFMNVEFLFRARNRFWSPEGNILISMTTTISKKKEEKKEKYESKDISQDKLKNLAAVLDGEKEKVESLSTKPAS